jgi:hypothetical protein
MAAEQSTVAKVNHIPDCACSGRFAHVDAARW